VHQNASQCNSLKMLFVGKGLSAIINDCLGLHWFNVMLDNEQNTKLAVIATEEKQFMNLTNWNI
jgi:hypothetical protein